MKSNSLIKVVGKKTQQKDFLSINVIIELGFQT